MKTPTQHISEKQFVRGPFDWALAGTQTIIEYDVIARNDEGWMD